MLFTLIVALLAAGYGAAAGALLPRAVYRFSVQPMDSWREECPQGHRLEASVRGWLGPAACPVCAHGGAGASPFRDDSRDARGACGPGRGFLAAASGGCCVVLALAVGPRPELAVWLLIAPPTLLLTAVDCQVQRLPDILTLPLAGGTAALLGLAALLPGAGGSWGRALAGGVTLVGAYFALFLLHPRGMGFGDVKLALTPGIVLGWYGWDTLVTGAVLGFLFFAGYGMTLICTGRAGRTTPLPFGVFMALGAFAGMLASGLAA